ncbi:MAG: hypothetical protein F6K50_03475 [Moorea sp. SIO3I7]|nr:hypothetical protein [Moorena sp. SIO3I7]
MLIYKNRQKLSVLFPSFIYCLFPIAYSLLPKIHNLSTSHDWEISRIVTLTGGEVWSVQ